MRFAVTYNSNGSIEAIALDVPGQPSLAVPAPVHTFLQAGADLFVSISGGKDSQAQMNILVPLFRQMGYTGRLVGVFADLGRIEWEGTVEHCRWMCAHHQVPFVMVKRPQGGMIERWEQRFEAIAAKGNQAPHWSSATNRYCTDHLKSQQINKPLRVGAAPFWSSASNRYCTAELKRGQINKPLRESGQRVVCAIGIRAQESDSRRQAAWFSLRDGITTSAMQTPTLSTVASKLKRLAFPLMATIARTGMPKAIALALTFSQRFYHPKRKEVYSRFAEAWAEAVIASLEDAPGRLALDWNPILHWSIEQVWAACGTSTADLERRRALFRAGEYEAAIAGFPAHWAYVANNSRLSCSMCVLASGADIRNGARLRPDVWIELVELEVRSGWAFRQDLPLWSLKEHATSMPPSERQRLGRVLAKLGLIATPNPRIVLPMLNSFYIGQAIAQLLRENLELPKAAQPETVQGNLFDVNSFGMQ